MWGKCCYSEGSFTMRIGKFMPRDHGSHRKPLWFGLVCILFEGIWAKLLSITIIMWWRTTENRQFTIATEQYTRALRITGWRIAGGTSRATGPYWQMMFNTLWWVRSSPACRYLKFSEILLAINWSLQIENEYVDGAKVCQTWWIAGR